MVSLLSHNTIECIQEKINLSKEVNICSRGKYQDLKKTREKKRKKKFKDEFFRLGRYCLGPRPRGYMAKFMDITCLIYLTLPPTKLLTIQLMKEIKELDKMDI